MNNLRLIIQNKLLKKFGKRILFFLMYGMKLVIFFKLNLYIQKILKSKTLPNYKYLRNAKLFRPSKTYKRQRNR